MLKLLGSINTYLLFFDIVSSEPGPTTTVARCGGACPSAVHLKRYAGKKLPTGASSSYLLPPGPGRRFAASYGSYPTRSGPTATNVVCAAASSP